MNWTDIRAEHVERAGGEDAVEALRSIGAVTRESRAPRSRGHRSPRGCAAVRSPAALGWTGRRHYDLDEPADARVRYERVIVEAFDVDVLARILNADRVRAAWPHLYLPSRVRRMWEARFPQLTGSRDRCAG